MKKQLYLLPLLMAVAFFFSFNRSMAQEANKVNGPDDLITTANVAGVNDDNNSVGETDGNIIVPGDNKDNRSSEDNTGNEKDESGTDVTNDEEKQEYTNHSGLTGESLEDSETKEMHVQIDPKLYPNPAVNFVTIEFGQEVNVERILVIDVIGKTVMHFENILTSKYRINTTDLNKGIYLFQIKADGQTLVKKVHISK